MTAAQPEELTLLLIQLRRHQAMMASVRQHTLAQLQHLNGPEVHYHPYNHSQLLNTASTTPTTTTTTVTSTTTSGASLRVLLPVRYPGGRPRHTPSGMAYLWTLAWLWNPSVSYSLVTTLNCRLTESPSLACYAIS